MSLHVDDVWCAVLPTHGPILRSAMTMLASIPTEDLRRAIEEIDRSTTWGPMVNPTLCRGQWFDRAESWKRLLQNALEMRMALDRGDVLVGKE